MMKLRGAIALIVLFNVAGIFASFGQTGIQNSNLQELKNQNRSIYDLIIKIKTDKNDQEINQLVELILAKERAEKSKGFFSKTDTTIFTNIPELGEISDADLSYKYAIIRTSDTLRKLCRMKPDSVIYHIHKINELRNKVNQGRGLEVVKKMSGSQKDFLRPIINNAINLYADYNAVAGEYNPLLLPTKEEKLAQLSKLKTKYKKPIQEAFIKQQLSLISSQN